MTKDRKKLEDKVIIDRLLETAKKFHLLQGVKFTSDMAMRPEFHDSHIFADAASKFLSQYGSAMNEDYQFGKTILLAGFGAPYKHGVEFRGMMNALGRNLPVEVLKDFSYDDIVRAELILGYRKISLPSPKLDDEDAKLDDPSLAINHPTLGLKSSGHYISQLAGLLDQQQVKDVRAEFGRSPKVDLALIAFASEFIEYEIATDRHLVTCPEYSTLRRENIDHIAKVFAQSAPLIAASTKQRDAQKFYQIIFQEGRGHTPEKAGKVEYYRDALKTYVDNAKPTPPQRAWQTTQAA